eukprot:4972780-Pyramimonas_sp.AAC.1
MQRIQDYVEDSRRPPAQPEGMDVDDDMDHEPDRSTPPSDLDDEEGQGNNSAPAPPSRQERMNATPIIAQGRWAAILARHPPGGPRKRGPATFPTPLLMAAVRGLRAEL